MLGEASRCRFLSLIMATTEEPLVVSASDEEPDSVPEISSRTKGCSSACHSCWLWASSSGYPAVVALAVAPLLLVAVGLFMVGRRPGGNLRRAVRPSQLTRGETATALITSINNRVTRLAWSRALDRIAGQPVDILIPGRPAAATTTVSYASFPSNAGNCIWVGHTRTPRSMGVVRETSECLGRDDGARTPEGAAGGGEPGRQPDRPGAAPPTGT